MFMLLVEVEVRPELLAEFRDAIRSNAARSVAHDDGCLRFDVAVSPDAANQFVLYEVYTNEAAWQAHRRSAHFLAYQAVADRALISRKVRRLQPLERASAQVN